MHPWQLEVSSVYVAGSHTLPISMLSKNSQWVKRMKSRVRGTPSASCCESQTIAWWCWSDEKTGISPWLLLLLPLFCFLASQPLSFTLLLTLCWPHYPSIVRNVRLCYALAVYTMCSKVDGFWYELWTISESWLIIGWANASHIYLHWRKSRFTREQFTNLGPI